MAMTPEQLAAFGMDPSKVSPAAALEGGDEAVNIDDLLNQDLDTIPDMPDFVTPQKGVYKFHVEKVDTNKMISESRCIQLDYKVLEAVQVTGESGDVVKPGDMFSQIYFISTKKAVEFQRGVLKKLLLPVSQRFGTTSIGATLEKFQGCTILAIITHRKDKSDPDRIFAQIQKLVLADG